jgi:hypothetical protein
MSNQSIQHRAAAVRKSWTYGERLKRVVAAHQRCQQLLMQLGLSDLGRQLAYARYPTAKSRFRNIG